jgi:predicted transcriptional regulator
VKFPPESDIKKIRRALDISQAELSAASGVSQSTIAKIENGKISAGYRTIVSLFEALEKFSKTNGSDRTAAEVSSPSPVSVDAESDVGAASDLMRKTGFSQLPVLRGGTPVGSISERRILELMESGISINELRGTPIYRIMAESFPVVSENTPLSSVSQLMTDSSAVLVSRQGEVVGMITRADLLKLI